MKTMFCWVLYLFSRFGNFLGICGDLLTFGAGLKWPFQELRFYHFCVGFEECQKSEIVINVVKRLNCRGF